MSNWWIIGVDPGDSTGVAVFERGTFIAARQGEPHAMITVVEVILDRALAHGEERILACERYISGGRRAQTHQPVAQQLVGVMQNMADKYGARFIDQGPADARACASNEMLKRMGIIQSGTSVDAPDANDANMAIRHALLAMSKVKASTFERIVREAGVI